jgi:hypothetical protein
MCLGTYHSISFKTASRNSFLIYSYNFYRPFDWWFKRIYIQWRIQRGNQPHPLFLDEKFQMTTVKLRTWHPKLLKYLTFTHTLVFGNPGSATDIYKIWIMVYHFDEMFMTEKKMYTIFISCVCMSEIKYTRLYTILAINF